MNFNLNFQRWAVARTRMKKGDQEAPILEKFLAVFSGLDDYFLERHRLNLTDASSLASIILTEYENSEYRNVNMLKPFDTLLNQVL